MAHRKTHKDVEFMVLGRGGIEKYYDNFDEATLASFASAVSTGQWTNISVLVNSEAGARWWGGDDAVERYRSDPDASVFEQLAVNVRSNGMIA